MSQDERKKSEEIRLVREFQVRYVTPVAFSLHKFDIFGFEEITFIVSVKHSMQRLKSTAAIFKWYLSVSFLYKFRNVLFRFLENIDNHFDY